MQILGYHLLRLAWLPIKFHKNDKKLSSLTNKPYKIDLNLQKTLHGPKEELHVNPLPCNHDRPP